MVVVRDQYARVWSICDSNLLITEVEDGVASHKQAHSNGFRGGE